jgi:hypothetical protein
MIKIMQMEMLNAAGLVHQGRSLVKNAIQFV